MRGIRRVTAIACLLATSAWADTPPWAGVWLGGPHQGDGGMPQLVYAVEAGTETPVAHGLPFGLNRGTCERGRVAGESGLAGGGALTSGLDAGDQDCVAAALDYLPDARMVAWAGGDGAIHRVMPLRSWLSGGRPCREVAAGTQEDGRFRQVRGIACLGGGGRWEVAD